MGTTARLERLELVQKDTGEIVLQAVDGDEPLLQLRFSQKLALMLGADPLTLAQAMVEAASTAVAYAEGAGTEDVSDNMIRLHTTPLH